MPPETLQNQRKFPLRAGSNKLDMPERRVTQYSVDRLTLKAELSASTLPTVRSRTEFFPEKVNKIENISNEVIRQHCLVRKGVVCGSDCVVAELDRMAEPLRFSGLVPNILHRVPETDRLWC